MGERGVADLEGEDSGKQNLFEGDPLITVTKAELGILTVYWVVSYRMTVHAAGCDAGLFD